MKKLYVEVSVCEGLTVSTGCEPDALEGKFSVPSNEDGESPVIAAAEGAEIEIIYKADVEPCVIIGLRSTGFSSVSFESKCNRPYRLLVALGSEAEDGSYADPVLDERIDCNGCRELELKVSTEVA